MSGEKGQREDIPDLSGKGVETSSKSLDSHGPEPYLDFPFLVMMVQGVLLSI